MSENGEIYTAGKNFTLPLAVTGVTNSTSGMGSSGQDSVGTGHFGVDTFWENLYFLKHSINAPPPPPPRDCCFVLVEGACQQSG